MKLVEHTIKDFAEVLASAAPAPGGGSTAALEGALGAALTHMVVALTLGREKYREHQPLMEELEAKALDVKARFLDVIDRDTEAFNQVSAALALPKATDEEKEARKAAMQEALKACTLTPYEMMALALEGLELTHRAMGKSNASAASDLGVAAVSLRAAVQGAWLNILINIGGIKDTAFADKYRSEGEQILGRATALADEIYSGILACM